MSMEINQELLLKLISISVIHSKEILEQPTMVVAESNFVEVTEKVAKVVALQIKGLDKGDEERDAQLFTEYITASMTYAKYVGETLKPPTQPLMGFMILMATVLQHLKQFDEKEEQ